MRDMKKRLLFIEESLDIGGAEKSLITLLSLIDYNKYDIDLFLFKHEGDFMSLLPKEVNLLPSDKIFEMYNQNRKLAPLKFIMNGYFIQSFHAAIYLVKVLFHKVFKKSPYIGWEHISYMFSKLEKEYDVAISFLENKTFYYNVDKVKAKRRLGFIHIDYSKYYFDYKLDNKYMAYMDKIPTVSEHCKEVLQDIFPQYSNKFCVIKNMISSSVILGLSQQPVDFIFNENEIILVTVGRLTYQKGIDNAIKICKELVDLGYNIKWLVVGKGEEQSSLEELIKANNLEKNFFLLGAKINPYKYMNLADIYVQPSRFEGFGITVAEAKCLGKPIVATNIPEFQEQLIDGETGLLCNNIQQLLQSIISLIEDTGLRSQISKNLKNQYLETNIEELWKLDNVIG